MSERHGRGALDSALDRLLANRVDAPDGVLVVEGAGSSGVHSFVNTALPPKRATTAT